MWSSDSESDFEDGPAEYRFRERTDFSFLSAAEFTERFRLNRRQVYDLARDMLDVIQRFHAMAGFPEVCGVVDGILINIDAPTANEPAFVDRHGKHSINCMAVCGPDMKFYYVSANWPGSVHDARVMRNSFLFRNFENGWRPYPNGVILGDSAYPLKQWLIPPTYEDVLNQAQNNFNRAHKQTRRIIENAFGILRKSFHA